MNPEKYYSPSGSAPPAGKLLAYGICTAVTLLSSLIYILLVSIILSPFIIPLITILFCVVLGYAIKISAKLALLRNRKERLSLAIYTVLIAYYMQWVGYVIVAALGFSFEMSGFAVLFIRPDVVIDSIIEINKTGLWSLGSISGGVAVKGLPLTMVWIFEAALIIAVPALIVMRHPLNPFSENLNKWYTKYVLQEFFERVGVVEITQKLDANGGEILTSLGKGVAQRHLQASIFYLEKEDQAYLTLENVYFENGGRGSKKAEPLLANYKIDSEVAKMLIDKYHGKKQFYLDY